MRGDFSWAWRQSLAEGLQLHLQVTSRVTSLCLNVAHKLKEPFLPGFYQDPVSTKMTQILLLRAIWGLENIIPTIPALFLFS